MFTLIIRPALALPVPAPTPDAVDMGLEGAWHLGLAVALIALAVFTWRFIRHLRTQAHAREAAEHFRRLR